MTCKGGFRCSTHCGLLQPCKVGFLYRKLYVRLGRNMPQQTGSISTQPRMRFGCCLAMKLVMKVPAGHACRKQGQPSRAQHGQRAVLQAAG